MIRRVQQQVSSYCIQIQLRALAFACMAFWLLEGLFISFSLLSHSLSLYPRNSPPATANNNSNPGFES